MVYYSALFFEVLVTASLISLLGVFAFQIWAFVKDRRQDP